MTITCKKDKPLRCEDTRYQVEVDGEAIGVVARYAGYNGYRCWGYAINIDIAGPRLAGLGFDRIIHYDADTRHEAVTYLVEIVERERKATNQKESA
jgi:hypothetical protein